MITRDELLAYAEAGTRQSDVARALGVTRQRVHQMVVLYDITWPAAPTHVHGPDKRPKYRPGCPDCRDIIRDVVRGVRARAKEKT